LALLKRTTYHSMRPSPTRWAVSTRTLVNSDGRRGGRGRG
jgi:hypothetical protein